MGMRGRREMDVWGRDGRGGAGIWGLDLGWVGKVWEYFVGGVVLLEGL